MMLCINTYALCLRKHGAVICSVVKSNQIKIVLLTASNTVKGMENQIEEI